MEDTAIFHHILVRANRIKKEQHSQASQVDLVVEGKIG